MPAISIKDLRKYYGEVKAVDGVSLEVEEREIFGILGPNGEQDHHPGDGGNPA